MYTRLRTSYTGSPYRPGLPPGLYEERVPATRPARVRLDTAAFVGLAEMGPVNTPVLVRSPLEFRAVFGNAINGPLLPQAVSAFLANGGRQCMVVRSMNLTDARTARFILRGLTVAASPEIRFAARNPGSWGNRLALRLRLKQSLFPLRRAGDALLAPANRAKPGVTLRLLGKPVKDSSLARIVDVEAPQRGAVAVTLDRPVPPQCDQLDLLGAAQELSLRLEVTLDEKLVEVWDDAGLHYDHPDFLPRILGRRAASERLLPGHLSGALEADATWGGPDDPPGSSFVRPSLGLQDAWLLPDAALLAAPDGLVVAGADLADDHRGMDGADTTTRACFFNERPSVAGDDEGFDVFADRPGALDALAGWDETHVTDPVALVALPDLLHPPPIPDIVETPTVNNEICFGPCTPGVGQTFRDALEYRLLGGDTDGLQDWQSQLVDYCEAAGGRIALLDLPPGLPSSEIVNWRRALASDRAALFAPWLRAAAVDDPLGAPVSLPPSAAAAGLIARVEQQIGVFASPGNQTITGVFALAEDPGLPEPGFLHLERIDVVGATEKGIQLMGSRTTSLDPDGTHINVRRVIDWLKAQLALDLAWAPFEPNDSTLWSAMVRAAEQRLRGLFDAGGLAGNTEQEAYFVRCDTSTNLQPELDAGRAIMLVGVAPAVPAEFLVFRLIREGGSQGGIGITP